MALVGPPCYGPGMASNRSTSDIRRRVLLWKRRGLVAKEKTGTDTWTAYDIAEKLGVSPQTVYYHLHALERAGELKNGIKRYRRRTS